MTVYNSAQHDLFGQFLCFRFHHQHRSLSTGNDQIHFGLMQLRDGRIQHVLTINVSNTCSADRAVERNARYAQRSRRTDHRRNIRVDLWIHRQYVNDDLNFIQVTLREQRADRTIDQARRERLFFGRASFALEETTGDTSGSIGFFDIVDSQREEILPGFGFLASDYGRENNGIVNRHHDGA